MIFAMKSRKIYIASRSGKDLRYEVHHNVYRLNRCNDIHYEVQYKIHFKDGVSLTKTKHLNDCSKLHWHNVY